MPAALRGDRQNCLYKKKAPRACPRRVYWSSTSPTLVDESTVNVSDELWAVIDKAGIDKDQICPP